MGAGAFEMGTIVVGMGMRCGRGRRMEGEKENSWGVCGVEACHGIAAGPGLVLGNRYSYLLLAVWISGGLKTADCNRLD